MYELDYVKKRRRKKAAAIVGGIGTAGVTALAIVAFLGHYVGTFTVTVRSGEVKISLSENETFETEESVLETNVDYPYKEYSYGYLPYDETLDDESTNFNASDPLSFIGSDPDINMTSVEGLKFFKYTYYVKNVGSTAAKYRLSLNITDSTQSTDGRSLEDTLRVMIYANGDSYASEGGGSNDHASRVFAKASAYSNYYYDENGELQTTNREFIAKPAANYTATSEAELAETFVSSNVVAEYVVTDFEFGNVNRYTVVTWLEGYDPQSLGATKAPEGAKIKLGVEINAYENQ